MVAAEERKKLILKNKRTCGRTESAAHRSKEQKNLIFKNNRIFTWNNIYIHTYLYIGIYNGRLNKLLDI